MERLIEKMFYIKRKSKTKIEYHFLQIKERDDYFVCLAEQSNFHIVKTEKITDKGTVRSDTAKHLQINVWRR